MGRLLGCAWGSSVFDGGDRGVVRQPSSMDVAVVCSGGKRPKSLNALTVDAQARRSWAAAMKRNSSWVPWGTAVRSRFRRRARRSQQVVNDPPDAVSASPQRLTASRRQRGRPRGCPPPRRRGTTGREPHGRWPEKPRGEGVTAVQHAPHGDNRQPDGPEPTLLVQVVCSAYQRTGYLILLGDIANTPGRTDSF